VENCIAVRNGSSGQVTLYLEPWGEEYQMPEKSEFVFIGHGPKEGSGFTIDYRDTSIVVGGWTGSVVWVFCQGKELGDGGRRPPVPDFSTGGERSSPSTDGDS
jgi:hypothetical protein